MNQQLNIGDKIGFVILANGIDDADKTIFFPIVEVTDRDGERAYKYEMPDGTISRAAIRQSDLSSHAVQIEAQVSRRMICLSERKNEFFEALERGRDNDFDVYADFDKDAFVVVNKEKKTEYRVSLETHGGQLWGSCECRDFEFRKRLCKHLGEVLTNALFTVKI